MKQPLGNVRGIFVSGVVGAALLFTGCGSSSGSKAETQNDNVVDSTLSTVQVDSLVSTLDCLLGAEGAGLGLSALDLQTLVGAGLTPDTLLGAVQGLNPGATSVEALLATPLTMAQTLDLLSGGLPAGSDALAVVEGLKTKLTPDVLGQNVDLASILTVPTDALPLSLADAQALLGNPTNALVLVENMAQGVAGDVGTCAPQAAVVLDTVDCLLVAGSEGLGLSTADLQSLAVSGLTPDAILAAVQGLNPDASTVTDLLATTLSMGDALNLLSALPLDTDALAVVEGLKTKLAPDVLGQNVDLASLLAVPTDALPLNLADAQALLGNPTDALALVEGLAQQSTGGATQCLQPEMVIASLGSMMGAENGLSLAPADLLTLAGTELTLNDMLAMAQSINPAATTVEELLASPLPVNDVITLLGSNLPEGVQAILGGVSGALPVGQTIALGDILTLPSEMLALPVPLDPMNTSVQGALGATTNLLAMMQFMARYMDTQSAVEMLSGMATHDVITTVGNTGGFVVVGTLMTQLPSTESVTAVVPADLQELATTILSTEDPLAVVNTLLNGNLVDDLLGGLLGGSDLTTTLTGLLGDADLAGTLSGILGGLSTDPTATLQTLQAVLGGLSSDPTATLQTLQALYGVGI